MGKIICTISLVFAASFAYAQNTESALAKGNEFYKKQQYDQAADEYQKAAAADTKNAKVLYNLGNALYKAKKPEEAEKAFDAAAASTMNGPARSNAFYNKGVTLSQAKKLKESVDAYKDALKINPEDNEARENLQKALNEMRKQPPPPQPKPDQKKQNDKQKQKQPEPEKNDSKLNKKQVEQMLSALRQDEKKIQQDLQKKNNTVNSNSKDW